MKMLCPIMGFGDEPTLTPDHIFLSGPEVVYDPITVQSVLQPDSTSFAVPQPVVSPVKKPIKKPLSKGHHIRGVSGLSSFGAVPGVIALPEGTPAPQSSVKAGFLDRLAGPGGLVLPAVAVVLFLILRK